MASYVAAPMASYVPSPVIATPQMVSQQMAATPPLPTQELGAMYAPRAPLMTQPVPPASTEWRSLTGLLSMLECLRLAESLWHGDWCS